MAVTDKLELILKIADDTERRNALLSYAKSVRVNVLKAKTLDGGYNEDELAVLIYDAVKLRQLNTTQNAGIILAAVFIIVMFIAAFFLLRYLMSQ